MLYLTCFLVTFAACVLGTVCGMGGGIIIKPVLDAVGVMSVAAVTFLSGCTVIAMSCWNVGKTALKRESALDLHSTPFLALGAALGGLAGKKLFQLAAAQFADQNMAGGVQACLLFCATFATLLYTIKKTNSIQNTCARRWPHWESDCFSACWARFWAAAAGRSMWRSCATSSP